MEEQTYHSPERGEIDGFTPRRLGGPVPSGVSMTPIDMPFIKRIVRNAGYVVETRADYEADWQPALVGLTRDSAEVLCNLMGGMPHSRVRAVEAAA